MVGGEDRSPSSGRARAVCSRTQAFCPHAGAPLADGIVGSATVLCPLHAFAFDLESGRCLNGSCSDLRHTSSRRDGTIRLQLPTDDSGSMILVAAAGRHRREERPRDPSPFSGQRVALLEARLASEAAALVRRLGGEPVSVPALREEPLPSGPAVSAFLDRLSAASWRTSCFRRAWA